MERTERIALGERLREARTQARLSVKEMAAALSVSGQAIYAYEEGRNEPPLSALIVYARRTGRSLDELVPGGPSVFVSVVTTEAAEREGRALSMAELAGLTGDVLRQLARIHAEIRARVREAPDE